MSYTTETVVKWIEAIVRDGVNTTAWEDDFIESMEDKISMYGDRAMFTPKQAEIVERIYCNRVP